MKSKSFILSLFLTFFLSSFLSSFIPGANDRLQIGKKAPEIIFSDNNNDTTLTFRDSQLTVVNFWSASDPASRMRNREFNRYSKTSGKEIRFISICTDADIALSKEIMKLDGIDNAAYTFTIKDIDKTTFKEYRTDKSLSSYFINHEGRLTAPPATPATPG